MGFNGRALKLIRQMNAKKPAAEFLSEKPCGNLLRADHFHADLYGNYIPPGCTGLGIALGDLGSGLDAAHYPVLSGLYSGGLKNLYNYAIKNGFTPDETGYASKCDLCFNMRKHLTVNCSKHCPDLTPGWYYRQDF